MRQSFRVVILGAGFAGLEVAQRLARSQVRRFFQVTLIDRQEHHTFQPLLHQVVTGELGPGQVGYPVRSALRWAGNVRFVCAEVRRVVTEQRRVETSVGGFDYDFLVVATGAKTQRDVVIGGAEHAFELKTIADAIALQRRVFRSVGVPRSIPRPNPQPSHTVVIVGGGTTGVELAAAMAESMQLCSQPKQILLLHSRDHVLSGFRPWLQRYALRRLQRIGVDVQLNRRVSQISAEGVTLADGDLIPAQTVVWTAGVRGNPPALDGKAIATHRLPVRPTLQQLGDDRIYVVGDVSLAASKALAVSKALAASNAHAEPWPMLASVAVQQGRLAAQNLQRQVQGKHLKTFQLRHLGAMAILGRHAAVIQLGPLHLTGITAWVLWLFIHLLLLRGMRQRLATLLRWSQYYQRSSPIVPRSIPASDGTQLCERSVFCVK